MAVSSRGNAFANVAKKKGGASTCQPAWICVHLEHRTWRLAAQVSPQGLTLIFSAMTDFSHCTPYRSKQGCRSPLTGRTSTGNSGHFLALILLISGLRVPRLPDDEGCSRVNLGGQLPRQYENDDEAVFGGDDDDALLGGDDDDVGIPRKRGGTGEGVVV
eukprot:1127906-Rhodomonas_salina.1